jgi:hypothetical protein
MSTSVTVNPMDERSRTAAISDSKSKAPPRHCRGTTFRSLTIGAVLFVAALVGGCGESGAPPQQDFPRLLTLAPDETVLQARLDRAHDRMWVLRADRVEVYEHRTRRLLGRIALPGWSVGDLICGPDIAFAASGAAYISHNVEPRIWQVDPGSLVITEHAIRLVGRENLDIGFGRLSVEADGSLLGVAAVNGTRWKIDLASGNAVEVKRAAGAVDCS